MRSSCARVGCPSSELRAEILPLLRPAKFDHGRFLPVLWSPIGLVHHHLRSDCATCFRAAFVWWPGPVRV